jgi:hypothetical protein
MDLCTCESEDQEHGVGVVRILIIIVVYYESIKRESKIKGIYECRCDERLQTKTKKFTRLTHTAVALLQTFISGTLSRLPFIVAFLSIAQCTPCCELSRTPSILSGSATDFSGNGNYTAHTFMKNQRTYLGHTKCDACEGLPCVLDKVTKGHMTASTVQDEEMKDV